MTNSCYFLSFVILFYWTALCAVLFVYTDVKNTQSHPLEPPQ